jgi:hypothetical protein
MRLWKPCSGARLTSSRVLAWVLVGLSRLCTQLRVLANESPPPENDNSRSLPDAIYIFVFLLSRVLDIR